MQDPNPKRLGKTLSLLLRHRPELGKLALDEGRWADLEEAARAAGRLMRQTVDVEHIRSLVGNTGRMHLEIDAAGSKVRALARRARMPNWRGDAPEILYHGTSRARLEEMREGEVLRRQSGRELFFSSKEEAAWQVAHRLPAEPLVLFVDARLARRKGVVFRKRRNNLYTSDSLAIRHVLNLQEGFGHQLSAGGFLYRFREGKIELALVSCERGRRRTWEVAKGKLEAGESPEDAAVRELQEEMGFEGEVQVTHRLGSVRYAFLTPEKEPRLKTLFLFLMKAEPCPEIFSPALEEGIVEVRWVPLGALAKMVTHASLKSVVKEVTHVLGELDEH